MNQKEIVVMKQLACIVQSLALRQGISRDDALMSDLRHVEYQLDSLMFSARHPTIAEWNINPIQLECGVLVAPSDFYIISEKGKVQEFFTMEEAQKLIVPVLKDTRGVYLQDTILSVLSMNFSTRFGTRFILSAVVIPLTTMSASAPKDVATGRSI